MTKKIVFVINYFYPDPASTGQLLTELCLELQRDFKITVIAEQPQDDKYASNSAKIFEHDKLQNIKIVRLKLPKLNKFNKLSRLKYILCYFILANIALLGEKSVDIIYSISTPPILGGLIGTIGKYLKHAKHVYNIQDFNPEQAEAIGYSNSNFIYSLARAVDNFSCKHSDNIIVVGQDMAETLKRRFNNKKLPRHQVINNWTDENEIIPLQKNEKHVFQFLENNNLLGKFIVMYSGNLGLYYDLENLITVTKQFADFNDIIFIFVGEGAVKAQMKKYVSNHNINNVMFLSYQPKEYIKYSLNAADVHLVVNQKGIKGVSVPSKIYGVMAVGKPILGVLEKGSEAERLITTSNCGKVVEPNDYKGVGNLISYFYNLDIKCREEMGMRGRFYLEQHLRKKISIEKYKKTLLNL